MLVRLMAAAVAAWLLLGLLVAEAANSPGYWGHLGPGAAAPLPQTSAARANGEACRHLGDCKENNCRRHPDGGQYCAALGRVCPVPGSDGARAGKKTSSRGQCYECKLGRGWVPCE
jgi:hypothetical protein